MHLMVVECHVGHYFSNEIYLPGISGGTCTLVPTVLLLLSFRCRAEYVDGGRTLPNEHHVVVMMSKQKQKQQHLPAFR
jgi:hypothetical protein